MRVLLYGDPHAIIPDGAGVAHVDFPDTDRYVVAWPWWRRWLTSFGVRAAVLRFDEYGRRDVRVRSR